jgi:hypothetical protein
VSDSEDDDDSDDDELEDEEELDEEAAADWLGDCASSFTDRGETTSSIRESESPDPSDEAESSSLISPSSIFTTTASAAAAPLDGENMCRSSTSASSLASSTTAQPALLLLAPLISWLAGENSIRSASATGAGVELDGKSIPQNEHHKVRDLFN